MVVSSPGNIRTGQCALSRRHDLYDGQTLVSSKDAGLEFEVTEDEGGTTIR